MFLEFHYVIINVPLLFAVNLWQHCLTACLLCDKNICSKNAVAKMLVVEVPGTIPMGVGEEVLVDLGQFDTLGPRHTVREGWGPFLLKSQKSQLRAGPGRGVKA